MGATIDKYIELAVAIESMKLCITMSYPKQERYLRSPESRALVI